MFDIFDNLKEKFNEEFKIIKETNAKLKDVEE